MVVNYEKHYNIWSWSITSENVKNNGMDPAVNEPNSITMAKNSNITVSSILKGYNSGIGMYHSLIISRTHFLNIC